MKWHQLVHSLPRGLWRAGWIFFLTVIPCLLNNALGKGRPCGYWMPLLMYLFPVLARVCVHVVVKADCKDVKLRENARFSLPPVPWALHSITHLFILLSKPVSLSASEHSMPKGPGSHWRCSHGWVRVCSQGSWQICLPLHLFGIFQCLAQFVFFNMFHLPLYHKHSLMHLGLEDLGEICFGYCSLFYLGIINVQRKLKLSRVLLKDHRPVRTTSQGTPFISLPLGWPGSDLNLWLQGV